MNKTFVIIALLLVICGTTSTKAQKAYKLIRYQGSINGNKTNLLLADGYLLASKATIYFQSGERVFTPSADGPDSNGELRFEARARTNQKNSKSWLKLKGIDKPSFPSQLTAVYWDGKLHTSVVFKQSN